MADSSSTHKRSKSGAIASLLHRKKSKDELPEITTDTTQELAPPIERPRAEEYEAKLDQTATNTSFAPTAATNANTVPQFTSTSVGSAGPSVDTTSASVQQISDNVISSPSTMGPNTSIEQSVRLFKIFEALRQGDTNAISRAVHDTEASRLEGTTILHLSVQCAEPSVVDFVLSTAGPASDVNVRDREGNTPLHIASQLGRTSVVKILLDQTAVNESLSNYKGKTALDLARNPDVYSLLQLARSIFIDEATRRIQALVRVHDYDALEEMLADDHVKSVVDVNIPDLATDPITVESGGTLLHQATREKDIKLIQLLLLNGADPFRRDRKGKLPQDITKDDRTKQILKKSPAAAAAQRGIQEKAILGANGERAQGNPDADGALGAKEAREMKGYLKKWTNYTTGWKLRWFVLEDGVMSYYKHQDDAGSACRGAINMRIGKLHMDAKEKLTFEIHGKSSVKYYLKANHEVEAKRWFWSLNNAIQWAKDEAREENKRQKLENERIKDARSEQLDRQQTRQSLDIAGRPSMSGTTAAPSMTSDSLAIPEGSVYEPSLAGDDLQARMGHRAHTASGDSDDDADYLDEDSSQHNVRPANKDAFNITAQSAKMQLDLLASVSTNLQRERQRNPQIALSATDVENALVSYDTAVGNLRGLLMDMLKIHKDHDAYWQHRLDREANVRRLWEESMARAAREQEELESKIGESEDKRKRTKRALRDALEGGSVSGMTSVHARSRRGTQAATGPAASKKLAEAVQDIEVGKDGRAVAEETSVLSPPQRRMTLGELTNEDLSDDDSDMDEEFFDAVDAGEVEVVGEMPRVASPTPTPGVPVRGVERRIDGAVAEEKGMELTRGTKAEEIEKSYKGYEDGIRKKLNLNADNRPKVSLWGILKNMIGKDMTKMTLPVSFNEPTSLLYRVVEDMQYTDLLGIAADRTDSSERMLYVTAFAASEYASTIGRVAKPFNPLLGETYEYVRPDKGYRFFIEQVSHHPPIGAAYAESEKWDYYGESSVKSKFYGKSFDINPLGTWFLRLRPTGITNPDGSQYEELYTWKKVTSSVIGIITGSPTVDNYGPMEIKNHTTGETCILDFKARGWKASSAFQVSGRVSDESGNVKWSIGGRWNDKIYARLTPGYEGDVGEKESKEGKAFKIWEADPRPAGIPFNLTPFAVTLNALPERLAKVVAPTDSRRRPDQRAMEEGEYDVAATEKERLEDEQRKRRRDREARGEEFVPRWFTHERDQVTGEEYWKFSGEYWNIRDRVAQGKDTWQGKRLEEIY